MLLDEVCSVVSADVTNTTATPVNIPGLSFDIGPNEQWTGEFYFSGSQDSSQIWQNQHATISLTGPAGASVVTGAGYGHAYGPVGTLPGSGAVLLSITNGPNAGTVQLQLAACGHVNLLATVKAGGYVNARRIA